MREIPIALGTVAHGNKCLICQLLDKGFNAETCPPPSPSTCTVKRLPYWVHLFILPSFRSIFAKGWYFSDDFALRACNKTAVNTRQAFCPSTHDMCARSVQSCVTSSPPPDAPCSQSVYRPDFGMEKRLPSIQNQWLLFSLLQRPLVICNEYKARIVTHKTHTQTHHLYVHSP